MDPLKISVVIPAFNEEKRIETCMTSVIQNSENILHEVIVVDNNSVDQTFKLAAETAQKLSDETDALIKIVREEKRGTSAARQKGFECSTGELIAFLDADTIMQKDWVKKVIHEFSKNKKLVALSGPYNYYDLPLWQRGVAWLFWYTLAHPFYMFTRYMAMGGNLVIKRDVLEKMGGLNTSLTFYGDDTDMVRRASAFGKTKFKFNFTIDSSGRRFIEQGLLKTASMYALNFLSQIFIKRAVSKDPDHVR